MRYWRQLVILVIFACLPAGCLPETQPPFPDPETLPSDPDPGSSFTGLPFGTPMPRGGAAPVILPPYPADPDPCPRLEPDHRLMGMGRGGAPGQEPLTIGSPEALQQAALLTRISIELPWFADLLIIPGSEYVAIADGNAILFWDLASGQKIGDMRSSSRLGDLAISPDGALLAAVVDGSEIQIWRLDNGERIQVLAPEIVEPENQWLTDLGPITFSPDGRFLAAGQGRTILLWDARSFELIGSLQGRVVDEVPTWDGRFSQKIIDQGHSWQISALAFSSDGQTLASAAFNDTVRLWDVTGETHLRCLEGSGYSLARFSPDGAQLLTSNRSEIAVWDARSGRQELLLPRPKGEVPPEFGAYIDARFTPDGDKIVTASNDSTVRIWDAQTGVLIGLIRHPGPVYSIDFGPDGLSLLTGTGTYFATPEEKVAIWLWRADHEQFRLAAAAEERLEEGIELALAENDGPAGQAFANAQALTPYQGYDMTAQGWQRSAQALHDLGVELAVAGETDRALAVLARAQAMNSDDQRDLSANGLLLAQYRLSALMRERSISGDVDGALSALAIMAALQPGVTQSKYDLDWICRYGSAWDRAGDVLGFCDQALAQEDDEMTMARFHDSRGIARALTGNYAGSYEDFVYYIEVFAADQDHEAQVAQRREWIIRLQQGQNPIDTTVIEDLREEGKNEYCRVNPQSC